MIIRKIPQNQRNYPALPSDLQSDEKLKESMEKFTDQINKSASDSIVDAVVISIIESNSSKDPSSVLLKIKGRKAEVKIPLSEFYLDGHGIKPVQGDRVSLYCKGSSASFSMAKLKNKFPTLLKVYKDRETVQGVIYKKTKTGFEILMIDYGVIGFLSLKEADISMIKNPTKFKESPHPFLISKIVNKVVRFLATEPVIYLTRKVSDIKISDINEVESNTKNI